SKAPFADRISLWQGDITRLKTGAIVNAANSQMLGCFVPCHRCIDNAIHSAAGMQLREECYHIMQKKRMQYGRQYEEATGTATLTKAYNLPCDYVIHTVGPIVYGELNEALRQDLQNCYESALKCCVENNIKSIAFCCISTGEFHFPNAEAAEIAVQTVTEFLQTDTRIERVIFNVFKQEDYDIYRAILGG
ncbi:MAG: macro domain-containing protein, partial [Lachnospiraceae bacterium]|nr:macro domain-containing protein [Lachnospiraceae bacterium]